MEDQDFERKRKRMEEEGFSVTTREAEEQTTVPERGSTSSAETFSPSELNCTCKQLKKTPDNIATCESITQDFSYEYFPHETSSGATTTEIRPFYPERTIIFYSFALSCTRKSIRTYIQSFGEVEVLKFVKWYKGMSAIAVFEERGSALTAALFTAGFVSAEYICTAFVHLFGDVRFDGVFRFIAGEAVSSNTVVTALMPKDANHTEVIHKVCVGEVTEISLFPQDQKNYFVHLEFVEPLDAAIAIYISEKVKVFGTCFYGKLHQREFNSRMWNDFNVPVEGLYISHPLARSDYLEDIAFFVRTPYVVHPTEVVSGSRYTFERPVFFPDIMNPLKVIHIVAMYPVGGKELRSRLYESRLKYLVFSKSKVESSSFYRSNKWASLFTVAIEVRNEPEFGIDVFFNNKNSVFPKLHIEFFEKGVQDFAFLYPYSNHFSATEVMFKKREYNANASEVLKIERSEKDEVFIHLPCNASYQNTLIIPFIFQYPSTLSDMDTKSSADEDALLAASKLTNSIFSE